MRHHVVIVAAEDRFGISRLPELFNRAGARVTLFGRTVSVAAASRFVQQRVTCDPATSSFAQPLRAYLEHFHGVQPYVVLSDEASLGDVLECRGEKWARDIYPVNLEGPEADAIFRKVAFMKLAAPAGVPVPEFAVCRSADQAISAAKSMGFPLFFKRDVDCAGHGVVRVERLLEVQDAFNRLSFGEPVLLQREVVGRLGKAEVLFHRGVPVCALYSYALQTWPGPYASSCARSFVANQQLASMVKRVGSATGFHGLAGIDWIEEQQSGQFKVIEFNGRPITAYHLGKFCGVDFSRALAGFLAGTPIVQQPVVTARTPEVRMFPQDLRRCVAERDIPGLLRWLPGMSQNDIPWNDPALIVRGVGDLLRAMTRHIPRTRQANHPIVSTKTGPALVSIS